MGIFKSGVKSDNLPAQPKKADNTRLIYLMNNNSENRSQINFNLVLEELTNGACSLLVPSLNDDAIGTDWTISKGNLTLKITSIFEIDGLRVLGVFTDEAALLNWSKTTTPYSEMIANDVLELAKNNGVNRIVINSDLPNIFILEYNSAFEH